MIKNIGDLFDAEYGQKGLDSVDDLAEGKTMLISSAGEDNGCIGFYDIQPYYKKPFITVPRTGSVCEANVQLHKCCVNSNVIVLLPREEIEIGILYQVAHQIRLNKWRYTFYGRTVTPEKIKRQKIRLEEIPTDFKKLFGNLTPETVSKKAIEKKKMKMVSVTDLCTIDKKEGIPQNEISSEGNIPYVSSSSKDNGVILFTDEKPNAEPKSLTVAKDGNDGYSFYQPYPFLTSIHNYILRTKNNYPSFLLLYVGAVIKKRAYCYNHYYPLSKKHLERIEIPMPLNEKGEYDLDYIQKIVENAYGYKELKKYL